MTTACRVLLVERQGRLLRTARFLFTSGIVEAASPVDYEGMLDAVRRHGPNVLVVDLEGFALEATAAIEAVMAERPTPILVLTVAGAKQDGIVALAAGALEVIERPGRPGPDFWKTVQHHVLLLSKVRVVAHVRGKRRARLASKSAGRPPTPVVAVASSLGGPKALARLLGGLPGDFAAPIAVCQHITAGFTDDLARWLSLETGRKVVEASHGAPLERGTVYVAPSDAHLVLQADERMMLDRGPPLGGFRPACDVLLGSAASAFGPHAIGVVLTGMGRDGARGLCDIRARGGHTIAQDEATSVVWGMPGEAIALGGAERVLPLDAIARQLDRWVVG